MDERFKKLIVETTIMFGLVTIEGGILMAAATAHTLAQVYGVPVPELPSLQEGLVPAATIGLLVHLVINTPIAQAAARHLLRP